MNTKILEDKKKIIDEISQLVSSSSSTIIAEYRGMLVKDIEILRRELAKENAHLYVFKNTLFKKAIAGLNISLKEDLEGPNAFIFSKEDLVAGPKVLEQFTKKNEKLVIKRGIVDKKEVSKEDVLKLAKLPNKNGLLSMFVGCLNEPMRKLASTLQAIVDKAA